MSQEKQESFNQAQLQQIFIDDLIEVDGKATYETFDDLINAKKNDPRIGIYDYICTIANKNINDANQLILLLDESSALCNTDTFIFELLKTYYDNYNQPEKYKLKNQAIKTKQAMPLETFIQKAIELGFPPYYSPKKISVHTTVLTLAESLGFGEQTLRQIANTSDCKTEPSLEKILLTVSEDFDDNPCYSPAIKNYEAPIRIACITLRNYYHQSKKSEDLTLEEFHILAASFTELPIKKPVEITNKTIVDPSYMRLRNYIANKRDFKLSLEKLNQHIICDPFPDNITSYEFINSYLIMITDKKNDLYDIGAANLLTTLLKNIDFTDDKTLVYNIFDEIKNKITDNAYQSWHTSIYTNFIEHLMFSGYPFTKNQRKKSGKILLRLLSIKDELKKETLINFFTDGIKKNEVSIFTNKILTNKIRCYLETLYDSKQNGGELAASALFSVIESVKLFSTKMSVNYLFSQAESYLTFKNHPEIFINFIAFLRHEKIDIINNFKPDHDKKNLFSPHPLLDEYFSDDIDYDTFSKNCCDNNLIYQAAKIRNDWPLSNTFLNKNTHDNFPVVPVTVSQNNNQRTTLTNNQDKTKRKHPLSWQGLLLIVMGASLLLFVITVLLFSYLTTHFPIFAPFFMTLAKEKFGLYIALNIAVFSGLCGLIETSIVSSAMMGLSYLVGIRERINQPLSRFQKILITLAISLLLLIPTVSLFSYLALHFPAFAPFFMTLAKEKFGLYIGLNVAVFSTISALIETTAVGSTVFILSYLFKPKNETSINKKNETYGPGYELFSNETEDLKNNIFPGNKNNIL